MKKVLLIILTFISCIVLLLRFGSAIFNQLLGIKEHSGVKIETNTEAQVKIDNSLLGKTPFQKEDLIPGQHLVELDSSSGNWKSYVTLTSGTLTIVNRELAATSASSSGEIITLESGQGVTVISNPAGATVEIDGKEMGTTPLSLSNVSSGEHLFAISHTDYLKRSVRAVVNSGYNLTLQVDLALSEPDLSTVNAPVITQTQTVKVLSTPTGFLNVRSSASTGGAIVEQVKPGDTLTLLEEQSGWDKVKLSDGKEGYVSSSYVQKNQ